MGKKGSATFAVMKEKIVNVFPYRDSQYVILGATLFMSSLVVLNYRSRR